ncbi:MAG: hypothetical protein U0Q12_02820 [Vicinamibacterales bacterium]
MTTEPPAGRSRGGHRHRCARHRLRRAEFYQLKPKQALSDTGIMVSLGAELDGLLVGFLLARVYYGESACWAFPPCSMRSASIQTSRGARSKLGSITQLWTNLLGLGIATLRTEVGWDNLAMIQFFHWRSAPAPRLC